MEDNQEIDLEALAPRKDNGTKQVIVIRHDLNIRRGKQIAQGAHASLKVFLDRKMTSSDPQMLMIDMTKDMAAWVEGIFTKICVRVNSEEELLNIYREAGIKGLPCALIQDQGLTELKPGTYTACAIGPAKAELIDEITGKLQLL